MRRTLIAGLIVGSLSGFGAVAVFAETDLGGDMPADKLAAIDEARSPTHIPEQAPNSSSWRQATPDAGAPGEVANVKVAVAGMLDRELLAGAMPQGLAQRAETAAPRRAEAAKIAVEIWAPDSLGDRRAELLAALKAVEGDASYHAYTEARYMITEWQGVTVTGDKADVTLLGHEEFRAPGEGWNSLNAGQIQIQLVRTGDGPFGWQMLGKSVVFRDGEAGS